MCACADYVCDTLQQVYFEAAQIEERLVTLRVREGALQYPIGNAIICNNNITYHSIIVYLHTEMVIGSVSQLSNV
jgi:hypothetical protein